MQTRPLFVTRLVVYYDDDHTYWRLVGHREIESLYNPCIIYSHIPY